VVVREMQVTVMREALEEPSLEIGPIAGITLGESNFPDLHLAMMHLTSVAFAFRKISRERTTREEKNGKLAGYHDGEA